MYQKVTNIFPGTCFFFEVVLKTEDTTWKLREVWAFFTDVQRIFYMQRWWDGKMGLCLLQLAIFLEQYFSHRHLLSFIQSLVTFVKPEIQSIKWKIYY